jgi:hypothetical protein
VWQKVAERVEDDGGIGAMTIDDRMVSSGAPARQSASAGGSER